MSYEAALEAAGAKVLALRYLGSYQGVWAALVKYDGERGWVQGTFGSCSHCDSFEGEFGWGIDPEDETEEQYQTRLADFGRTYLDGLQTTEQVAAQFDRDAEWDSESEEAAKWVRDTGEWYGNAEADQTTT